MWTLKSFEMEDNEGLLRQVRSNIVSLFEGNNFVITSHYILIPFFFKKKLIVE